jgi:hypothetical protein
MTDDSLVGLVVMAMVPGSIYVGKLEKDDPPTLAAPYLMITGGSTRRSDIRISESSEIVNTPLQACTPEMVEERLQKFRCYSPMSAQAVGKMVEGLYFS